MRENREIQEYIGSLTKEETLFCLENDLIIKDSCVLESRNPFFGYFMDFPQVEKPRYLYLMLKNPITFIEAQRLILKVSKSSDIPIDAVLAQIKIPGYPAMAALRVRDLPQYGQLSIVQEQFINVGLHFKKHKLGVEFEHAVITLEKFFFLEMIEEGFYFDVRQAHHGYFLIPENIEWEAFKKLTQEVKYDTSLLCFDAARASIFTGNQLYDLVRIYKNNINMGFLRAVRARYYQLLKI
ncbi:MAG: hypothetical protein RBR87_03920 [Bacteroidales bacterium]|jgi:hypothetical protein|nr:hypothetical protein [Bacteroidales bacterium]